MNNFWDFSVWGTFNLVAVLLVSLLLANMLKKYVKFLKNSLIPTSVLGGILILIASAIYKAVTGVYLFDTPFFGGDGMNVLEIITYHALALGFIASSLKTSTNKLNKKRTNEIFNTGVTTVSTYLLQGVLGLGITIVIAMLVSGFFAASGVLLPFGFGQGTGQALNYGNIYETDWGFDGGRSFGLTVAALGFLCAALGGVIHLNVLKKKGKFNPQGELTEKLTMADVQDENEIPVNGSIDKLTVQLTLVAITYFATYMLMMGLSALLPGMTSVIYGFNFLIGVLLASLMKVFLKGLSKKQIVKRQHTNNFLLNRISNFFFDVMIIAGIAAIKIDLIKQYWWVLLILAVVGTISTYLYNLWIAKLFFKEYKDEQFLIMYGMLTGTASTGIMLLRELDPEFKKPAQENLILQNFPAIVFGFPLMLLATLAPKNPILTLILLVAFFIVMNLILFRSFIFKRKKKNKRQDQSVSESQPTETN